MKHIKTFESFKINEEEGLMKNLLIGTIMSLNILSAKAEDIFEPKPRISYSEYDSIDNDDKRWYQRVTNRKKYSDYQINYNQNLLINDVKSLDSILSKSGIEDPNINKSLDIIKRISSDINVFDDIEVSKNKHIENQKDIKELSVLFDSFVKEYNDPKIGKSEDYKSNINRIKTDIKYIRHIINSDNVDPSELESEIKNRRFMIILSIMILILLIFLILYPSLKN